MLLVFGAGCKKRDAETDSLLEPARTSYLVRGVVKELRLDDNVAVIAHEEIPGYMVAMTMPFDVKDPEELEGLKVNDIVTFQMVITQDDGWIEDIEVVGKAESEQAAVPSVRIVREVEPLAVGDMMPDYPFVNQEGEPFRLSDYEGKAYAMTFIFTRCPFPTFCPRMANNFYAVQEALKNDPDAPKNWQLLSISFDVAYDTPEVLAEYAATRDYDPEWWSWATSEIIEIDAITEQFGMFFARQGVDFDHNLRTAVVDANGMIQHIFIGNAWTPEELVERLKTAATVE